MGYETKLLTYGKLIEQSASLGYRIPDWFKPKATYWQDFSIADRYGEKVVQDTYDRFMNDLKNVAELEDLAAPRDKQRFSCKTV